MAADGFGRVNDRRDAAVGGPEVPLVEECFGVLGGLVEEVLEGEADLVGAGGFRWEWTTSKCRTSLLLR